MTKQWSGLRSVTAVLALVCVGAVQGLEYHVSPRGNDAGSGTQQQPFLSLDRARLTAQSARKERPKDAVVIYVHPGVHRLTKMVTFKEEDAGTPEHPLRIEGWSNPDQPGVWPVMTGGVVVTGWQRTSYNGRDDVWVADLAPLGIKEKFRNLFLNGRRQIWARYPNYDARYPYSGGWAYVAGERLPMYTDIEGEPCDVVTLREADARPWRRATDGEVCIFPRYNWWNRIEKIKAYDQTTRQITLEKAMQYAARPQDRFCIMGLCEELDAPGEWYQDVEEQKLYFIPPAGVDLATAEVAVPVLPNILQFTSSANIVVRGLEFCCAADRAINIQSSRDIVIEKSLIHDLGYMWSAGVSIRGGENCVVRGCDIWNIGGHGVDIYGGDSIKIVKTGHVVENCYIHHVGQFNRHGIGIMVSGVGVRMAHNLIHDTPRCAIFHGGTFNILEYNRMRHCNLEMEDTGITYTGGGNWLGARGTLIRYNHCSDSIGYNNHGKFFVFAWGIYLDENCGGCDVYGNIVERCQVGAMHLHNARDNHIFNNIFVHNAGRDGKSRQISLQGWRTDPGHIFITNRRPKMIEPYEKAMQNPEWRKMRGMEVGPLTAGLPDGTVMAGNRIERNIFYYPEQPESAYVRAGNCNLEYNFFDHNLVWNGGAQPVLTGYAGGWKAVIADLTAHVPNAAFAPTPAEVLAGDASCCATAGWRWYRKTLPDARTEVVAGADGKNALRMYAAYNPERKYIKHACVRSDFFTLTLGRSYRLSFMLQAGDEDCVLTSRVVTETHSAEQRRALQKMLVPKPDEQTINEPPAPFWKAFGQKSFRVAKGSSLQCETVFYLPQPGDKDYDERMGDLAVHFQFLNRSGWVDISDLALAEVEQMDEWGGWQAAGADRHSMIADPLFIDAAAGDYRLRPESPALRLGFEPIPFEKIGPYADSARATWPIVEAEGVRENPQWLEEPPQS